jgi:hypothetical protein
MMKKLKKIVGVGNYKLINKKTQLNKKHESKISKKIEIFAIFFKNNK